MELNLHLTPHTKIKLKMIMDLNVTLKTIKHSKFFKQQNWKKIFRIQGEAKHT